LISKNSTGGLTREYLTIITKEIFDPQTGLFCYSEKKIHIQPSSLSSIIPHHLIYFELAGLLLAKVSFSDVSFY